VFIANHLSQSELGVPSSDLVKQNDLHQQLAYPIHKQKEKKIIGINTMVTTQQAL
jgi:hypothetical protein